MRYNPKGHKLNLSLEERQRRSERMKGMNNPVSKNGTWNKGQHWSEEIKQKMRGKWTEQRKEQHKLRMKALPKEQHPMFGKKRPDWLLKMQETMRQRGKIPGGFRSSIEDVVCEYLNISEIRYECNKFISHYNVDVMCIDYNVIIEVNGCYWHGCPLHYPNEMQKLQHTIQKTTDLEKMGFIVINIWEHDVNGYIFDTIGEILDTAVPIPCGEMVYFVTKFNPVSANTLYDK